MRGLCRALARGVAAMHAQRPELKVAYLTGGTGDLVFELELIELGSSKVTWRARVKLGFVSPRSSSDAAASGRDMGANIVARLRDDHALAGCPAPWSERRARARTMYWTRLEPR